MLEFTGVIPVIHEGEDNAFFLSNSVTPFTNDRIVQFTNNQLHYPIGNTYTFTKLAAFVDASLLSDSATLNVTLYKNTGAVASWTISYGKFTAHYQAITPTPVVYSAGDTLDVRVQVVDNLTGANSCRVSVGLMGHPG